MMIETILAVLAVVSFLSATVMAMFAWKINSDWCQICGKMLDNNPRVHKCTVKGVIQ